MTALPIIRIVLLTIVASVVGALIGTLIRPVVGYLFIGAVVGAGVGLCCAYARVRPYARNFLLFLTFRGMIGRLGLFVWMLTLALVTAGTEITPEGAQIEFPFWDSIGFTAKHYLYGSFRIPYGAFADGNLAYWTVMISCFWLLICAFLARARALNFGGIGKFAVVITTVLLGPNGSAWIVFLCLLFWITPENKAMPASASGEDSATQTQAEIGEKTERQEEEESK